MEKRYLFTPGPTPVPPEVLTASAEPIVHHRGADFRHIYASALGRLKDVFRTESDVLLFTASGTGAMESAVANLCAAGDRPARRGVRRFRSRPRPTARGSAEGRARAAAQLPRRPEPGMTQ